MQLATLLRKITQPSPLGRVSRDASSQMSFRRVGHDLPETYLIPNVIRAIDEVVDPAEFVRLVEEEKSKKPEFAKWLQRRRVMN